MEPESASQSPATDSGSDVAAITVATADDASRTNSTDVSYAAIQAARRHALSQEIDDLFRRITELRIQMNANILIAKLPPEILGHVFLCSMSSVNPPHRSLTSVAGVCHHWREVALNTPVLWRDITINRCSPEWIQACIARSKQVPLRVQARDERVWSNWMPVLETIASEMGRVESLTLTLDKSRLKAMVKRFPSSAPLLQSLEVQYRSYSHTDTRDLAKIPAFLSSSPALTQLKLSGFNIGRMNTIFSSSLTLLSITYPSDVHESMLVAPTDLTEALRGLAMLKALELREVFAASSGAGTSASFEPISLPHLSRLNLAGSALTCTRFVDCCVFPASVSIDLQFKDRQVPSESDIQLLVPSLRSKLMTPLNANDTRAAPHIVTLSGHGMQVLKRGALRGTPAHLMIRMSSDPPDGLFFLGNLCSQLPVAQVSGLFLRDFMYPISTSMRLLEALQNVAAIGFISDPPVRTDIISLLDARKDSPEVDPQKWPHFLPNLKRIAITNVRFRDAGDEEDDTFVKGLVRVIKARRQTKQAVGLVIKTCINMDEEDVKKLRKATKVAWDGKVNFEEWTGDDDSGEYMDDDFYSDDEEYYGRVYRWF